MGFLLVAHIGNFEPLYRYTCYFRLQGTSLVCAKGSCRIRAALRIVLLSLHMRAHFATMLRCNLRRVCCGLALPLWGRSKGVLMRARHSADPVGEQKPTERSMQEHPTIGAGSELTPCSGPRSMRTLHRAFQGLLPADAPVHL